MSRRALALTAALLSGLTAYAAAGSPPRLVANLNLGPAHPDNSSIDDLLTVGNQALVATTFVHGDSLPLFYEPALWITDGTAQGTRLLRVFQEGYGSVSLLANLGSSALFASPTGALWRSDGTVAGTFQVAPEGVVVDDQLLGQTARDLALPVLSNGTAILSACTIPDGCEPWASDGTPEGTRQLANLAPGPESVRMGKTRTAAAMAFVIAHTDTSTTLIQTDGTASGTRVVAHPANRKIDEPIALGSKLLFVSSPSSDSGGSELWVAEGPRSRRVRAFASVGGLAVEQGRLFFVAETEVDTHIWVSDGTAAGTVPLPKPLPDRRTPVQSPFTVGATRHGVLLRSPTGVLFRTHGRPASTHQLRRCPGGCPRLLTSFGQLPGGTSILFLGVRGPEEAAETGLWVTDGSAAGTRLISEVDSVCDLCPADFEPFAIGGRHFFAFNSSVWASDGTSAGTSELGGVYLWRWAKVGDQLVYSEHLSAQLFLTDGSPSGRRQVATLVSAEDGSAPFGFTELGGRSLFFACREDKAAIWVTDGTADGTALLVESDHPCADPNLRLVAYHGLVYFLAGNRLWRTDGTVSGTVAIEPRPEVPTVDSAPLGRVADYLIWTTGENGGVAIHRSDGVSIDAVFLARSDPHQASPLGDYLYFEISANRRRQLWRSDGTLGGTVLVADNLSPVAWSVAELEGAHYLLEASQLSRVGLDGRAVVVTAGGFSSAGNLVEWRDALYFSALVPEGESSTRWLIRSNGTSIGTVPVTPIGDPTLVPSPNQIFFKTHDPAHGVELWRTDGTVLGTRLVADIASGTAGSSPSDLAVIGNLVYFAADDQVHGREPWVSDGTSTGTRMLADIAPVGLAPSWPAGFTRIGSNIFFRATDGEVGQELWVQPVEAP